nr:hypothetical protein C5F59_05050 [Streptomyces sp. QL37]
MVGGPKANELAEFLLELGSRGDLTTARSFAHRFPGGRNVWAQYLNGSTVIPSYTLSQVVEYACGTDARKREQDLARAKVLHRQATAEARASRARGGAGESQGVDRELTAVHQLLADTRVKLDEAHEAGQRARAVIALLMAMCARAETSVRDLTEQRDAGRALHRAQTEQRLDEARLRLERTERELERTHRHLGIAQRVQKALLKEAEEARRESERLRRGAARSARRPDENSDSTLERAFPARREIVLGRDGDLASYDRVLELIAGEAEEREQALNSLDEATDALEPPVLPPTGDTGRGRAPVSVLRRHVRRLLGYLRGVLSPRTIALALALAVLAALVAPLLSDLVFQGRDDGESPAATGEPGTIGDARRADPCGLLDSASLSRFGRTRLTADYGEINRCDVLVGRNGIDVAEAQVYLDAEPAAFEGVPVRTVGNVEVASFPREEDACVRVIATADRQQIQIIGKQWDTPAPNLCELADAATDYAVGVLADGPVPRRSTEPAANSLALIDACTLLDAAALRHVPGVGARDGRPGFASWNCEWSDADGDSDVVVEYSRDNSLKDDGEPEDIAGTRGFVSPQEAGDDSCVVRFPHRTYTNPHGDSIVEHLQLTVHAPQSPSRLCATAQALTATAAKNIARHIAEK